MLGEAVPGVADAEVAATLESCDEFRVVPSGEIVAAIERETRAVHFNSRPGGSTPEERRPAVALPLVVGGKATGVLTVAGRPKGAGFAEDETNLRSLEANLILTGDVFLRTAVLGRPIASGKCRLGAAVEDDRVGPVFRIDGDAEIPFSFRL